MTDEMERLLWHDKLLIEKDAEIERLRTAMDLREEDHQRKTAEIERLRDLLAEALDSEISDYWYVRVREALGDE